MVCIIGCRSNHGCPPEKACLNNKCTDICASPTACGTNAECAALDHIKLCTCPAPLFGDATIACKRPVTPCFSDSECVHGHACYGGLCQELCRT